MLRHKEVINEAADGEEFIPKIQKGVINVANFNMAGKFNISLAIWIMVNNNIQMPAVQEHSPWGQNTSNKSCHHICRVFEESEYKVQVSKHQIFIIDKSIIVVHQSHSIKEEGCIITNVFQTGKKDYAAFFAIYGIPHGKEKKRIQK